jgi:hypothetical protein
MIVEAIKTFLYGPPGLQRMCVHPAEAHIPSWDEAPCPLTVRQCAICKGQCA